MTDLPAMTIANDAVDDDWVSKPRRWDIKFIKRFMLVFGILSSVFDYLTFGATQANRYRACRDFLKAGNNNKMISIEHSA